MPTYNTFIPGILKFPKEVKTTAEFSFNTRVIETAAGAEQRIPQRVEYLSRLSLSDIQFENCLQSVRYNTFKTFFTNTSKGKLNTFRFKNPLDYKCSTIAKNHGLYSSTILAVVADAASGLSDFKLLKLYYYGSKRGSKTIKYLDPLTTTVKLAGVTIPNTSWSMVNGKLNIPTATAAQANQVEIVGEFYTEYRFAQDSYTLSRKSSNLITISNLELVEPAQTSFGFVRPIDFQAIPNSAPFDLGFKPTYDEEVKVESAQLELDNRRVIAEQRMTQDKSNITIDGNFLRCEEKDNLLCLFLTAKGRLVEFTYEGSTCRFESDSLSLTDTIISRGINKD